MDRWGWGRRQQGCHLLTSSWWHSHPGSRDTGTRERTGLRSARASQQDGTRWLSTVSWEPIGDDLAHFAHDLRSRQDVLKHVAESSPSASSTAPNSSAAATSAVGSSVSATARLHHSSSSSLSTSCRTWCRRLTASGGSSPRALNVCRSPPTCWSSAPSTWTRRPISSRRRCSTARPPSNSACRPVRWSSRPHPHPARSTGTTGRLRRPAGHCGRRRGLGRFGAPVATTWGGPA